MERQIAPPSPTAPTPVDPEELLRRARERFPFIRQGNVTNVAAMQETVRWALAAARAEAELAAAAAREEDPQYLAFLGEAYLLVPDYRSARNCWLRAATLGHVPSLARLAAVHTEPDRALLYARLYREQADDRPAMVCANLTRLLQTEPTTSATAIRLYEEARLWQPNRTELLQLIEFATAVERFDDAEQSIASLAAQGEDVRPYQA